MGNYIHGLHVGSYSDHAAHPWTSTGAALMGDRPGVLVFTEIVGDGHDYRVWSDAGYTVLVRLNYSYGDGTIPPIPQYADFAQRCAAMVAASRGVDGWVLGNEPNASFEWPDGIPITAEGYAICFDLCRYTIQAATPSAQVLVAGMAPFNADSGDWVGYLENVLDLVEYDGVACHTYSHGQHPSLITSEAMMNPPYQDRHYEFRAYRDFMSVIPDGVPVWITETNPGADPDHKEWVDINSGWCYAAYSEIDQWNQDHPARQIHGLCLYRYPRIDPWWIQGKSGVEDDFTAAVESGYKWEDQPMAEWTKIYETNMDGGFYPYNGVGPLTVHYGSVPLWEHDANPETDLPRPEYAERHPPHTHNDTPYAAGLFSMHSTMEAALVWEIIVKPGDEVRASCWANGNDGDQASLGVRLGIAVDNPGEDAIEVQAVDGKWAGVLESRANWGDWYGARVDDEWQQIWSPVDTAARDRVWILMNARKDYANPGHTHWDDLIVEVRSGGIVPPPPGIWRNVTYDPAGNIVGEYSFEGPSVNPQICAHAQAIAELTCT